ncbi:hypothetical protein [Costertonia aggregata]|uniref:Uncharacterized protein n=1 Tax=Costertonia aggregata TaxID=343403 RepID=A0A7H9AR70_9FLAO|nr:hypothetical protein [Costertonia aggregata]QLG45934.1 hypothetical protein HYG79_11425 [Costertonia aggregata]
MKTTVVLQITIVLLLVQVGQAQQKKSQQAKDTTKQMNLVEAQFDVFKTVFGGDKNKDNSLAGFENYEQMLLQSDFDPKLKENLLQQYRLIESNTEPKQKDSLKLVFAQQLKKAMAESPKRKN